MSAQRDKMQNTHDISSDDRKTRQNALNHLMTKEKDWFKAKQLMDSAKAKLTGQKINMIWVDEAADIQGHVFDALKYMNPGQKEIRKKPDWKCSALMRHIRKEERHADPSKLVKWMTNRMVITQDKAKGTW